MAASMAELTGAEARALLTSHRDPSVVASEMAARLMRFVAFKEIRADGLDSLSAIDDTRDKIAEVITLHEGLRTKLVVLESKATYKDAKSTAAEMAARLNALVKALPSASATADSADGGGTSTGPDDGKKAAIALLEEFNKQVDESASDGGHELRQTRQLVSELHDLELGDAKTGAAADAYADRARRLAARLLCMTGLGCTTRGQWKVPHMPNHIEHLAMCLDLNSMSLMEPRVWAEQLTVLQLHRLAVHDQAGLDGAHDAYGGAQPADLPLRRRLHTAASGR